MSKPKPELQMRRRTDSTGYDVYHRLSGKLIGYLYPLERRNGWHYGLQDEYRDDRRYDGCGDDFTLRDAKDGISRLWLRAIGEIAKDAVASGSIGLCNICLTGYPKCACEQKLIDLNKLIAVPDPS